MFSLVFMKIVAIFHYINRYFLKHYAFLLDYCTYLAGNSKSFRYV